MDLKRKIKNQVYSFLLLWAFFLQVNPGAGKKLPKPIIPVNHKQLVKHVEKLTQIQPPRNYKYLASLNRVAEYIYSCLKEQGCRTSYQKYEVEKKI